MTQTNELDSVKRKIRALSEKTIENGATEAEMFMAMKKVGELLQQFNLTMDEVTVRQEKCVTVSYDTKSKHLGAIGNSCMAIAAFTDCRVWMSRGRESISINFFGLESDTHMALYLCELVNKSYVTEYAKFKVSDMYVNYLGGHRRVLNSNFQNGFSSRISVKLSDIKREQKEQEKAAAAYQASEMKDRMVGASDSAKAEFSRQTTGTALVMVEKSKHVESEFKKLGMKLRTTKRYSNGGYHSGARAAGSEAANRVNVNRPVGSGNVKPTGYLK